MRLVRAAICDDESTWLDVASRYLMAYAQEVSLQLQLRTYASTDELISSTEPAPDVLFCDIELAADASGVDLVRKLAPCWPHCQFVYVTNFLRYAPDVYATEHLWFVLKERFADCLPEVMEKLERKMADDDRSLAVQTTTREMLTLRCSELVSLERHGRVTTLKTRDAAYEVPDRLPALLERLPARSFVRCHGSFAVNLAHVRLVRSDLLVMDDDSQVPMSRRYTREFRERYLDWIEDHAV